MSDSDTPHIDITTKKRRERKRFPDEKKRREQAILREEKETEEVLSAGADDPTRARLAVTKQVEEEEKERKSLADEALNKLDMRKNFAVSYTKQLASSLAELLTQLDWIRGWTADCVVTNGSPISIHGKPFQTQKGVLLIVRSARGNVFHQGIKVTGEPLLDYAAIVTLALQTENTMDKARGLLLDGSEKKKEEIRS